jgi:hypothetical protein
MRERTFRLITLLIIALGTASCATITSNDLIHESASAAPGNQRFEGTVNVQFAVIVTLPSWSRHPFINASMLKEAVEKAITKTNLFTRVEQQTADYVLDIWMDKQSVRLPMMGVGESTAGVFTIWRLTRLSDGKVLVCDLVDGRGTINDRDFAPSKRSMIAAIQNMIQNGVATLSDQSNAHLSAVDAAGSRSSIGRWGNNVMQNWSKLRSGMTLAEVDGIIGPVRSGGAILDYVAMKFRGRGIPKSLRHEIVWGDFHFRGGDTTEWTTFRQEVDLITIRLAAPVVAGQLAYDGVLVVKGIDPTADTIPWDSLEIRKSNDAVVSQDYQCRSAIYTLEFKDDRLARWKLH